jgi:hypothetical protein
MASTGTLSTNNSCFLGFQIKESAFGISSKTSKKMENICLSFRSFTIQHPSRMSLGIASTPVCSPVAQMTDSSASGIPDSDMRGPTMTKSLSLRWSPILMRFTRWTSRPSTNSYLPRDQQTRQYRYGTCATSRGHCRLCPHKKMQ